MPAGIDYKIWGSTNSRKFHGKVWNKASVQGSGHDVNFNFSHSLDI